MNYQIFDQVLGRGAFGIVKLGLDRDCGRLVAIKVEEKSNRKGTLSHESRIIQQTNHKINFWEDEKNCYLAMDLLGPNVDSMHKICSRSFSLKTTLMLAMQMLECLSYYHKLGIIHRDVKPSNFLLDYTVPHHSLRLIDFGLAKKYKGAAACRTGNNASQVGSLRYMSKYIHSSIESSYRDDLYSLGYCIIFMFTGMLPWQGEEINRLGKAERKQYISKLKWETSNKELVRNCRCIACTNGDCNFYSTMLDYFNYMDSLEYETPVDYERISNMIRDCFKSHGFICDHKWDWNKYYAISPGISTGSGI